MHEPLATSGESAFMAPCNALMRRSVGPGPINEPLRAAQALCNGKSRGEAARANLPPYWKQSALAEEMRHAGDIEPESIGIQMRAVTARGPAGEIKQSVFILLEHDQ
jgi:hypothetical protein